jgi:hypothetical protein
MFNSTSFTHDILIKDHATAIPGVVGRLFWRNDLNAA